MAKTAFWPADFQKFAGQIRKKAFPACKSRLKTCKTRFSDILQVFLLFG